MGLDGFGSRLVIMKGKFDCSLKSTPGRGIKEVRVVSRRHQKALGWPIVNRLQEHGNKSFELANFGGIVPPLRHSVEFIQKEYAMEPSSKI